MAGKSMVKLLTRKEIAISVKNDLLKKELQYAVLERLIEQAEKEYKLFMAQPKDKKKPLDQFGVWRLGQAEIGQYKIQRENMRRDILMYKEYLEVLNTA